MMNSGSLKLRLFLAAALAISISLVVAGFSFYFIFQRYVERQAIAELENHYIQLIASIRIDDTGQLRARATLSDPRFQKPYGGLYWQINETGQQSLRSHSLFDESLPLPKSGDLGQKSDKVHIIPGPNSSVLFADEKDIVLPTESGAERKLHITMAIDRHDIDEAVAGFGSDLSKGLGLLYAVLLTASFLQVVLGLLPLEALRRGVEAIRNGSSKSIQGDYPTELRPLVEEVNGLIIEREQQLVRARQRASNLAHGLKTPLTVMGSLADSIAAVGMKDEAKHIHEGAAQMRNLVERELARARMASGHAVQLASLSENISRMINALKKTTDNDVLLWHTAIPATAQIAMEIGDLTELIGNLLDNARKWAKSQIYVSWSDRVLKIEDDGPGVPDDKLAAIQERGVRLDEKVTGTGLGLGIVRDLVEVYDFDLKLGRSSLGGLSVSIDTKPQALRMLRPA
jgi:signal transduction histidine kinase